MFTKIHHWFLLLTSLITPPSSFSMCRNSPHLKGLLWPSDHLVAEAAIHTTHDKYKTQETNIIPSAGFEPAIPTNKGLHTYSLDRRPPGSIVPPLRPNFLTPMLTLPNHTVSDMVSSLSSFLSRFFYQFPIFSMCYRPFMSTRLYHLTIHLLSDCIMHNYML